MRLITLLLSAVLALTSYSLKGQETLSLKANFTQRQTSKLLSDEILSEGRVEYVKNSFFKWEYLKPFTFCLTAKGDKIYIKEEEGEPQELEGAEQVFFAPLIRLIKGALTGEYFSNKEFTVSLTPLKSGRYKAELEPIKAELKSLFKKVEIILEKDKTTPIRVELISSSGDKTIIEFSAVVVKYA